MKFIRKNLFLIVFALSFILAIPFVAKALYDENFKDVIKDPVEDSVEAGNFNDAEGDRENRDDKAETLPSDKTTTEKDDDPEIAENENLPDEEINGGKTDEGEIENGKTENEDKKEPETGTSDGAPAADMSYFDDALFIGDSRTVGIYEYGTFSNSDFFADIGMSVYNVHKTKVSVSSVGKVGLNELLESKTYGKIFIMLGVNELGYDFDKTVKKYGELIDEVKALQPDAVIYIEGNLHVTKSRSDKDDVINNHAIDRFNSSISELADNEKVFYIDVNELFDDENGNLNEAYTSDNAHILGKYYIKWCDWICAKVVA